MNRGFLGVAFMLLAPQAFGQGFDSMQLAVELGSVLGSEEECSLSFNQDAIALFIKDKVNAEDMGFASMLQTMTQGQVFQLEDLSASAKTAHCTQIARVAKAYGFTE